MRNSYCYLPILPARQGAFLATQWLSPLAESRITPLFDIPDPVLRGNETLESHFTKRAKGISEAWPMARPVYVDMHNLPPQARMASGAHPLIFLFDALRMYGAKAIPVTGTVLDRDPAYTNAVREVIRQTRRGVCLRLAREDFENRATLGVAISEILDSAGLTPAECDLLCDFRFVSTEEVSSLRALALETLEISTQLGSFRNIILAGGSVPEQLGKQDQGQIRREIRVEFGLWSEIIQSYPVAYADYGVITPTYAPPKHVVNVPARIRYTTQEEHLFRRAPRADYVALCNELIMSPDFSGTSFSRGDFRIYRCAKGMMKPGTPMLWVASDANHHFELVSGQIWRAMELSGISESFFLPEPTPRPWFQEELIEE